MFDFFTASDFSESLESLDAAIRDQIRRKIKFLSEQQNPLLQARKLRGHKDIFRFRSGDYRIISRLEGKSIILLFVRHRKDVYEGL